MLETTLCCQDNLAFMGGLPGGSMRLVLASPNYNIGKEYETRQPLAAYVAAQREVIGACVRLLGERSSLCWQVGSYIERGQKFPLDLVLYPVFTELGLKLRNRIIWTYGHGLHCRKRLSDRHETILWFTRDDDYIFNLDAVRVPQKYPQKRHFKGPRVGQLSGHPLGKNPGDVWDIPNVKHNHVEKTAHPCQFPVELAERLVLLLTDPGDAVLDPYAGSGSTLVAALKHGRRALGCDTDAAYVAIARRRLAALAAGTLKTRPIHGERAA